MYVGYGAFALHLPQVRDLKSKRRVVRSLVGRIHSRFRVSVAETSSHELHQRAGVGIAVVAAEAHEVERILEAIQALVESEPEVDVLGWAHEVIEEEE